MSSINTNLQTTLGSIDENGLINDLDKRGFSIFQCLCELLSNSIDANTSPDG